MTIRWKVWPEKSGDPVKDNIGRRLNTRMNKHVTSRLHYKTPRGWKRKRQMERVETPNFIRLYIAVMNNLIAKDRADD
jgi:hypothetical protein